MAAFGSPEPLRHLEEPIAPPGGGKEGGEFGDAKKPETAKIFPFVRPAEPKEPKEERGTRDFAPPEIAEVLEDGTEVFRSQNAALISNYQEVATLHKGILSRIVGKGGGVYEVSQKKSTGEIVTNEYSNIDEIRYW